MQFCTYQLPVPDNANDRDPHFSRTSSTIKLFFALN